MRATLDTNVFVSALNFGGVPASLLDFHTDEMFTLCASPAIIAELARILACRFEWTHEDIGATLTPIFSRAASKGPLSSPFPRASRRVSQPGLLRQRTLPSCRQRKFHRRNKHRRQVENGNGCASVNE
jgi:hypothetical protein